MGRTEGEADICTISQDGSFFAHFDTKDWRSAAGDELPFSLSIIWFRYAEFGRERFRIAKPNQRNDKRLKSTLGGHVSVTPSFCMHLIRPLLLRGIPIKRDEILTSSSATMASLLPRSRARGLNSDQHRVAVQCISGLPESFISLHLIGNTHKS